jgi:RNA polymerase sigma-70 factor (ECF subfamily)
LAERTNDEWIRALSQPGPEHDVALVDLRAQLVRGLTYALADRVKVQPADVEDFAQDGILRILDQLQSFRGASRFTTWAHKIAVNVAFTELRRRRWRDVSLDGIRESTGNGDFLPLSLANRSSGPEKQAIQGLVLNTLRRLIQDELTDRQRQAITALMQGMPLQEVAARMDTNRNALYKLVYDARRRLQQKMLAEGLAPEDVLAAFES